MFNISKLKSFFSKHKIRLLFFIFFYVILGTCSLWIPAIIYGLQWSDVAMGFLTIVLSVTGYATIERVLSNVGKKGHKLETLINLIAFVVPLIICIVMVALINSDCKILALSISFILYLLSCAMWWYQNIHNENLDTDEAVNALGGSI